jgi:predicted transcriptional regulator
MVQLSKSEERLFNYLVTHKKPVPLEKLADRFLLNKQTVGKALKRLHDCGLADRIAVGGKLFYEIKQ